MITRKTKKAVFICKDTNKTYNHKYRVPKNIIKKKNSQ